MTDSSYPNQGVLRRDLMQFERDFTQLRNAWMRDKRLSFAARGLLAHLMTHDAGYQVSLPSLAAQTWKEGRDGIRTLVHELERCGYLHRVKERRARGKFQGYAWYLQDPFAAPEPVRAPAETLPFDDLHAVDNSPHRVGSADDGESDDGVSAASAETTTIEDQVKNISSTSVSYDGRTAPVDNRLAVGWSDDRCPGDWRNGRHELSEHGACRHCHERPSIRSAS
jgi:hypothetical protein